MTDKAKLAWSQDNGVRPPAFVVAAARQKSVASNRAAAGDSLGVQCGVAVKIQPCCNARHGEHTADSSPAIAKRASAGSRYVLVLSAMRCRGVAATAAALPPSLPVMGADFFPLPLASYAPPVDSILYESPIHTIAPPPPESAAA
jgi:hypothetical protein